MLEPSGKMVMVWGGGGHTIICGVDDDGVFTWGGVSQDGVITGTERTSFCKFPVKLVDSIKKMP